jgi:hypothetical protein
MATLQQTTPTQECTVDDREYRITALSSLRQRNLLLRLIKNFSGVLPLAKSEVSQALTLSVRGKNADDIKAMAAIGFTLATTIDTLIDNLTEAEMNHICGEFLGNTEVKNPDNGVFTKVQHHPEDLFSNRMGHLLRLLKEHMLFNYADFLVGSAGTGALSLLAGLESMLKKMGIEMPKGSSEPSTGSTTES